MPNKQSGNDLNPVWSHALGGGSLAVLASSGNFTTGTQFHVIVPNVACVGMRFWGVVAGSKTVKCKLYSAGGSLLASTPITISTTGSYDVYWSTPQALNAFSLYRVCTWQNDGLNYYAYTATAANAPARPFPVSGVVIYNSIALFLSGDTAPNNAAAAEAYPCEPILAWQ